MRKWVTTSVWFIVLCMTFLLACGQEDAIDQEQNQAIDEQSKWERHALDKEATLGLVRNYFDDGTFSYMLSKEIDTPQYRQIGATIQRYDGQARFSTLKDDNGSQWVLEPADVPQDLYSQSIGTVSIDAYGRRWVVDDFDEDIAREMIYQYNMEVDETVGLEPIELLPNGDEEYIAEPEQWSLWTPFSWNLTDCDSDGNHDIALWDADNRGQCPDPLNTRQKKVLFIHSPRGYCSATMVDSEWLLTAAHCVTDTSGVGYSPNNIDACTYGNYQSSAQCYSADILTVNGSWNGTGMNNDYAVIHLTSQPGVGWMAISQASDSTIEAAHGYHVGYAGYVNSCSSNLYYGVDSVMYGAKAYKSNGDVTGLTSNKIKTRIDSGSGHSGGPYFYYPGGCCGSHYITGVVSGHRWALFTEFNGGPKGPAIRSWVITNTP